MTKLNSQTKKTKSICSKNNYFKFRMFSPDSTTFLYIMWIKKKTPRVIATRYGEVPYTSP